MIRLTTVDASDVNETEAWALLPADERARADCFSHVGARSMYLAGRYLLRRELGHLLGQRPQSIRIVLAAHGKPCLPDGAGPAFSLSHSAGIVAAAFCTQPTIGLDIEAEDRALDVGVLQHEALGPAEQDWLACQPDPQAAFLTLWTLKEALMKADGRGFGIEPRGIELTAADDGWRVRCAAEPALSSYCLQSFHLRGGVRAAVATPTREDVDVLGSVSPAPAA